MPAPLLQVAAVRPGVAGWDSHVALFADYRAHYGQPHEPERCDRWLRDNLGDGRLRCYLATTGTHATPAAMAVVVVSPASLALGTHWQLRDLYVAPDQRCSGVGRAVVTAVADEARAAGALRMALQTEVGNAAALALYRDLGFEDVTGVTMMLLTL